jgi:hypothetical protein
VKTERAEQRSRPSGQTKLLQDKCSLRKIDKDPAAGSEKELEQQKRWQQSLQTGNRNSKRDTANLTGAHSERKASSQKDKDPVRWNTIPWIEVTGVKTGRDEKLFERGSEIKTGALACGPKMK